MANLYGPMQYRPNPRGISLNTPMQQFQPPAPVAPTAGPAPFTPLSFEEWARQNGVETRRWREGAGRFANANLPPDKRAQMQYDRYAQGPGPGVASPSAQSSVTGLLGIDPTAAAYSRFLNGGV